MKIWFREMKREELTWCLARIKGGWGYHEPGEKKGGTDDPQQCVLQNTEKLEWA